MMGVASMVNVKLIIKTLAGINFFAIFWFTISLIVGTIGFIILINEAILPSKLVTIYKFGKLRIESSIRGGNDENHQNSGIFGYIFNKIFNLIQLNVPKSYFKVFYIFGLIINIFFFAIHNFLSEPEIKFGQKMICFLFGRLDADANWRTTNIPSLIFILICLHLCRRIYETKYISIFSSKSNMNIIHFISGIIFYASLALCCHNLDISRAQEENISKNEENIFSRKYILNIFAIFLYLLGQLIQFDAHQILASLRSKDEQKRDAHVIPYGRLFNLISCPNYFAEIIIYLSLLILTNFDTSMSALTTWVVINQLIASLMSHRWYLNTFKHIYPKDRKAIIPFVL